MNIFCRSYFFVFLVLGTIAGCLFSLWPMWLRQVVYYLSLVGIGCFGLLFGIAICKLFQLVRLCKWKIRWGGLLVRAVTAVERWWDCRNLDWNSTLHCSFFFRRFCIILCWHGCVILSNFILLVIRFQKT